MTADEKLDAIRADVKKLTDHANSVVSEDIRALKSKIEGLEKDVNALKGSAVQRTPQGKVFL